MVSKVHIANLALDHVGARNKIESLTENSVEASTVNLWYDVARKMALQSHDWGFARRRVALAVDDEDAPAGEWIYSYIYPSDCLVVRRLEQPYNVSQANWDYSYYYHLVRPDAVPYAIERSPDGLHSILLTDLQDARLVYTSDVDNPGVYPTYFVMALSQALAHLIAFSLTGKTTIKDRMLADFKAEVSTAATIDATQEMKQPPRDADWIRARI